MRRKISITDSTIIILYLAFCFDKIVIAIGKYRSSEIFILHMVSFLKLLLNRQQLVQ